MRNINQNVCIGMLASGNWMTLLFLKSWIFREKQFYGLSFMSAIFI
ncbi:hypothetical protein [Acidiplasma aeolicum]